MITDEADSNFSFSFICGDKYILAGNTLYKTDNISIPSGFGGLPQPEPEINSSAVQNTGDSTPANPSHPSTETSEAPSVHKTVVMLQINNPNMTVNGSLTPIDEQGTAPIFFGQRAIVPVRAIVESLGGTVGWDEDTWEVTVTLDKNTIKMKIDSKLITVNGTQKEIDTAPQLVGKRTMLPIRFVAENLGLDVNWYEDTFEIEIIGQGSAYGKGAAESEIIQNTPPNDSLQSFIGYADYPGIPDFGRFLNIELLGSAKSFDYVDNADVTVYKYSIEDVNNSKDINSYIMMLEQYAIGYSVLILDGTRCVASYDAEYYVKTYIDDGFYVVSVGKL